MVQAPWLDGSGAKWKPCPFRCIGQPEIDDAGFDDGVTIAEIDFEDSLHPRQRDHDAAADRQAAARQARCRSPRGRNGNSSSLHSRTMAATCGRARKDGHVGTVLLDHEAIALDRPARSAWADSTLSGPRRLSQPVDRPRVVAVAFMGDTVGRAGKRLNPGYKARPLPDYSRGAGSPTARHTRGTRPALRGTGTRRYELAPFPARMMLAAAVDRHFAEPTTRRRENRPHRDLIAPKTSSECGAFMPKYVVRCGLDPCYGNL